MPPPIPRFFASALQRIWRGITGERLLFGKLLAASVVGVMLIPLLEGGPTSLIGVSFLLATNAYYLLTSQSRHGGSESSDALLRQIGQGVSGASGDGFVKALALQLSTAFQTDFAFVVELSPLTAPSTQLHTLTLAERGALHSIGAFDIADTACAEVRAHGSRSLLEDARTLFPSDALLAGLGIESFVAVPLESEAGHLVGILGVLGKTRIREAEIIETTLRHFAFRTAAEVERQRSEDELRTEKDRLHITLRSIREGFITIDRAGRVLLINEAAEKLTGRTQAQATGQLIGDVFQLVHPRTGRPCREALERAIKAGTAAELSAPHLIIAADRTERLIEITGSPLGGTSHAHRGMVFVFRDITARAQAEEERRRADKLESLGTAAGGIAHDFNNLLTAILGNISLVLFSRGLDEDVSERLLSAKSATLRAQELAAQLLTFAKGGAPVKELTSVSELVRETLDFSLQDSSVRAECHIDEHLWLAEIDASQVCQMLTNLIVNAQQAMPAGGALSVTCANVQITDDDARTGLSAGSYVRLTLRDEGIGIPEEHLDKIFDPYFTTKPKGIGLGLATAYSIIKNHGGAIEVDSRPGAGTTFQILLPANAEAAAKPELQPAASEPVHQPGRVLVLDDEAALCELVSCALVPLGYEVIQTYDGIDAVAAYQRGISDGRRFDLVISDLTIPGGMGGQEALRRLREIDPSVKAIVCSGYALDPVMADYREYGFCGMLAKPYEINALGRAVAEAIAAPGADKVIQHDFLPRKSA